MESAVRQEPASPGLAPLGDSLRTGNMDDPADSSSVTFAAAASSHEDEDLKESDGWKLHSDTSTISSRVTTPDPVVSSPPLTPFASAGSRTPLPGRVSNAFSSIFPLPPALPHSLQRGPERGRGRGRGAGRGTGRFVPRSPNEAARPYPPGPADQSRYGPFRPPLFCTGSAQASPPSSSPVRLNRADDSHGARHYYVPPHPPPPPPPPLNSLPPSYGPRLPTINGGGLSLAGERPEPPSSLTSQTSAGMQQLAQPAPGFLENSHVRPRPSRGKRNSRRSLRRRSDGLEDETLTFSSTRSGYDETSSSSSSSSNEDPFAYRNARQFPPQLPAGPAHGPSAPRSRSSAANQITAWVSQYEKSRSPTRSRSRLGDISAVLDPTDTESRLDGSVHSDDSSHGEIEMLWQQLKEKRAKLSGTRAKMRSRRKELREKRREKDAADNAFMGVVRPVLVSQGELIDYPASLFESRLEKMQQLRDDYQVLESSYEALEAMLDEEERDLSILETRFFSILAAGQTKEERQLDISSDSGAANFSIDQTEIPYELRGISPYGPVEEPHPLYVELTSTVGYLGNARDEYADLLSTKQQYEEEQQLKKTTKQKVSDEQEMKEFFDEFPYEEQRMNDIMTSLESKVNGLKKLCEDRGVMKKHMSIKMEYALDPQIRYEDLDLDDEHTIMSRRKTLAHTEFNELLSQPDHVLAEEPLTTLGALKAAIRLPNHHPEKGVKKRLASKEYAIDNLMRECDGGKKADYVNRWLLHQLRLSPLNAVLLRSTFQASRSLKIRDMWRWQCDVMHYWWRDSTMSLVDGFFKPITSDNSEYSSRVGTTQLSRAASDGVPRHIYQRHPSVDNSDAMTEHG
ncbi:hypothetical protein M441DRAFT_31523 [Trichoderma asperellum CBS 433.97]|uniref:Uncharacterized protein n=1 Tax=Trichoderma asperellum (strain ATCC 204424 / CBS 433.97 / NBRC 101777) TaxID=1042311 RepID=A0A2T3YTV3_TRIA4|nr:hypothetical protein M441DRAFT_31523 [Trichoderma asperellum CBS 433.97]PTB36003.1 hypothetical protein M441DRAFT_31523 [Trichoderma asperellum CBS 433.97]